MASTPKMEYQIFLCIIQKNSAMATLGLKEMGKFLWEGRENGLPCWLSQFRSSFGKCKKKSGIMKSGLDAMPLFLLDDLLMLFYCMESLYLQEISSQLMVHNNITFSLICLKSRKIDGKRGLCEIKKDKTNQNQSYVKKNQI